MTVKPSEDIASLAEALEQELKSLAPLLVAYSGGVDSAVLAYAAHRACGDQMKAVLAVGASLSQREKASAESFASEYDIPLVSVQTREMEKTGYLENDGQRCYYCKQALFERLEELRSQLRPASADVPEKSASWPIVYGVNRDDLGDYRPGLKAAHEAEVISPYLTLGVDKSKVRALAEHYGLSVASKPAMPCLASRIPHGQPVDEKKLSQVERGEDFLHHLGFEVFRVRHHDEMARLEILPKDMDFFMGHRREIVEHFKALGFRFVSLDLEGFRSGALNEVLTDATLEAAKVTNVMHQQVEA